MIIQCDIDILRQIANIIGCCIAAYVFYRVFIFKAASNSVLNLLERIAVAAEKIADKPTVMPNGDVFLPVNKKEIQS